MNNTEKREEINKLFIQLNKYCVDKIGHSIFNQEYELDDVINIFQIYFMPFYKTKNYKSILNEYMLFNNFYVDSEQFDKHYEIIHKYITHILSLISK